MTIQDGVQDPGWPPRAILDFGRHFEELVFIFQSDTHKKSILHMQRPYIRKMTILSSKLLPPFYIHLFQNNSLSTSLDPIPIKAVIKKGLGIF